MKLSLIGLKSPFVASLLTAGALCIGCDGSPSTTPLPTKSEMGTEGDATVDPGVTTPSTDSSATTPSTSPTTSPTNSGINERDRDSTAKTPIDQNENQKDIQITADIRKQVVATEMSTNAHNVKIITQDGKVTLHGPVNSADEKTQIEKIAVGVAGADQVDNQLEVAPN